MKYGVKHFYCDTSKAPDDYTKEERNGITNTILTWITDLFEMVIFEDWTYEDVLGDAYFIGKETDEYPRYRILWSAYSSTEHRLLMSYMTNGIIIDGSTSDKTYVRVLYSTIASSSYIDQCFWYAKSDNNAMISTRSTGSYVTTPTKDVKVLINFPTNVIYSRYSDSSLMTYDVYDNFDVYYLMANTTDIKYITNRIGSINKDYICPLKDGNGNEVTGIYLATKIYTAGRMYKINGYTYLCLMSSSYLSILMKLE